MKFVFFVLLFTNQFGWFAKLSASDTLSFIGKTVSTKPYKILKNDLVKKYANTKPGHFGEFVKGSNIKLDTDKKVIALTFDACGGKGSNGYNFALIDYLRKEAIPATLFVTGKWIRANRKVFEKLAMDTLFEIENHGDKHKLCSINGDSIFGIKGTKNVAEVVDEIELNAIRIKKYTGHRPKYFRSATAYIDETSVKIANDLGMQVVSFSVLSGDYKPKTSDSILCRNILHAAHEGAIVIMHFNHPLWNEKLALEKVIPELQRKGYTFVKLQDYKLLDQNTINKRLKATIHNGQDHTRN
jgi:peptidoglycan/xylan/chitin deacetylase (PgdA/CDA1 family)